MRFIALPLLCLGVALFFRTSEHDAVELGQKPEFRTSAVTLYDTFHDDRAGADKKYRDKVIQVSGQVTRIEQDLSGQVAIILQGSPARLSGVECLIHPSQIQQIQQLRSGQHVIVKGYGAGKKVHVRLRGCLLVHTLSASAVETSTSRLSIVACHHGPGVIRRMHA